MPDTLNLAEAAAFLRLGVNATKALLDDGTLPGVSLNQKHTVFLRRDLEQYIHDTALKQSEARRKAAEARANPQAEHAPAAARPARTPPPSRRRVRPSLAALIEFENSLPKAEHAVSGGRSPAPSPQPFGQR